MTSLERLLETPPTRAEVEEALVAEFAHVFGRRVVF